MITRWVIYGLGALIILSSLYAGYRIWRHNVWIESRNAVLEEVRQQNSKAKEAADRVERTTDQCFDDGGSWDVTTGQCDLGGATLSGARGLFGN